MRISKFISLLVLGLFLSCEETVTPPEIENIEDLLVVNGILNPTDTTYYVEVSWSNPSFGRLPDFGSEFVTNANVTITDGNTTRTFTYNNDWRMYMLEADNFPIAAGTSYQLRVEADGRVVTASVTTRQQVPDVGSFEFTSNRNLSVKWKDVEGTEDFYSVRAYLQREESEFTNMIPFYFDSGFISDSNRDGSILQDTGEGFDNVQNQDTLFITIYSYDKLYVDYFEILDNYVGDDPFSEATQLPSNIDGGLGIFAIVQQSELKVRVQ